MKARLKELENAVCDVIQIIKQIPELADTRLSVVGGLALCHYLPAHRPTKNIDFVTNFPILGFLRQKLLDHPNSPFIDNKQALWYRSPAGRDIQIKMSSQWLSPHLPDPEHLVYEIPYGQVPYVSLVDLVAFKINSSWSKASNPMQRRQDADDAAALIDLELAGQPPAQHPASADEKLKAFERKVVESLAVRSRQQESLVKEALGDVHLALLLGHANAGTRDLMLIESSKYGGNGDATDGCVAAWTPLRGVRWSLMRPLREAMEDSNVWNELTDS